MNINRFLFKSELLIKKILITICRLTSEGQATNPEGSHERFFCPTGAICKDIFNELKIVIPVISSKIIYLVRISISILNLWASDTLRSQ